MIKGVVLLLTVYCCAGPACRQDDSPTPMGLLRVLKDGCASRDTGLLLTHVDIHYQDELGGPGRLEDDLRRMFTVYGKLKVDLLDVTVGPGEIKGHAMVAGKRIRLDAKIGGITPDILILNGRCDV